MPVQGYTVSELAEKSKKTRHAVEEWLSNHQIKPLSYEAVYPFETLDSILNSKRGRPAKKLKDPTAPEPPKPSPKKPRKTSKPER